MIILLSIGSDQLPSTEETTTMANTAIAARTAAGLSDDELFRFVPSLFQKQAHFSRSERFVPVATIDVVRGLQNEGFVPVYAGQTITRDPSRREFTKHVIRFRKEGSQAVAGTHGEIVLRNGNDGSAAFNIMSGLFRIVCANGMITRSATWEDVKVRHSGRAVEKVIEGTFKVLGEVERQLAAPVAWSGVTLDREEQLLLADAARTVRLGDADGNVTSPISAGQFLNPRRFEDRRDDLWSTFNVIQEHAIRGGLSAYNRDTNRLTTIRPINSIDGDVKLNKALWTLGAEFAKLKGIAA